MAEVKIFAGPKVRRIRNGLGITQTAMAEGLGISPSYLNLIERNQRPLTVQLILKLASVYKIDVEALHGETSSAAAELREVFSDPLLAGEIPGGEELIEVAEAAPNVALGLTKLYRAYREQAARLTDLAGFLAQSGHETMLSAAKLPMDEVRETFAARPNHFAAIDAAAEDFHARLAPSEDLATSLRDWLRAEHGIVVRTLPIHAMPNLRRRYDRHSMRLFLSERLYPHDQLREMAQEACQIALHEEISSTLATLGLSSAEASRIGRFELARYAALALMMPYGAFLAAAQRARYDIGILCARFRVSFEQAANRLAACSDRLPQACRSSCWRSTLPATASAGPALPDIRRRVLAATVPSSAFTPLFRRRARSFRNAPRCWTGRNICWRRGPWRGRSPALTNGCGARPCWSAARRRMRSKWSMATGLCATAARGSASAPPAGFASDRDVWRAPNHR